MTRVSIYEQDCWGITHFRVMRDDGRLIFDRIMTDFESEVDAVNAVLGEFRRNKLGPVRIRILDRTRKIERVVAA